MSAVMTAPEIASPEFAAELWISLVSLLRSHVAMHSVARPALATRISTDVHSATLLGRRGKLIVVAPDASGTGSLEFRQENGELGDAYSKFFFTSEGLIGGDLEPAIDMEAAVEHWLDRVQK